MFWAWPAAWVGSELALALVPPHSQGPEDAPGISGFRGNKRKVFTVHEHTRDSPYGGSILDEWHCNSCNY